MNGCSVDGCPHVHYQRGRCLTHQRIPSDAHDGRVAAYVREVVDAAPPLTASQRDTLTLILGRRA